MKRKLVPWGCVVIIGLVNPGTVSHATTIAFYSDGVIQEGDTYDIVEVYDTPPVQTTVNMTGGAVGNPGYPDTGLFAYDSSTVNIAGGYSYHLYTHDSSTANISGGLVGDWDLDGGTSIAAYDSSTINVYDGSLLTGGTFTFFELFDSSELNVYGADIGLFLWAHCSASVNIFGGTLFDLWISDWSTVNVYGGSVGTFLENNPVPSTATVNFYGWGFEYKAEGSWEYLDDPADGWWVSKLAGYGFDGSPIMYMGLPDPALNPNIKFIPEPSTFLLCALGGLWLVRKRKTSRIVRRNGG